MTEFFSSAADIVSGAYPMPSHPSSVVGVVGVNFFSNRIGSFTFYSIFLIFGLNLHNNIAQKPVQLEFSFMAFLFFNGFLITKNGDFWWFWASCSKSFNVRPWNLIYRHIAGTSRCVWKMGPECKFSDPFWPQIVPILGRKPVFHLFCKRLPLDSHETCLLSSMELL